MLNKQDLMNGTSAAAVAQGSGPPQPQQASPEEQAQYDQLMAVALQLVYKDDKAYNSIKKMLKQGKDGLVRAATQTAHRAFAQARKRGIEFSPDVQAAAQKEIFEDLADLSGQSGGPNYEQDKKTFHGAYLQYADELRVAMQGSGMVDQAMAEEQFSRMQEMDQNGMLEQLLRDLAAHDRGGQKQPQQPAGGLNVAEQG